MINFKQDKWWALFVASLVFVLFIIAGYYFTNDFNIKRENKEKLSSTINLVEEKMDEVSPHLFACSTYGLSRWFAKQDDEEKQQKLAIELEECTKSYGFTNWVRTTPFSPELSALKQKLLKYTDVIELVINNIDNMSGDLRVETGKQIQIKKTAIEEEIIKIKQDYNLNKSDDSTVRRDDNKSKEYTDNEGFSSENIQNPFLSSWYSIKLIDNNIYYGQIVDTTADPIIVQNVYYDYDQKNGNINNVSGSLRLVKRGKETSGPDGSMVIIRSQIIFMEPLSNDSKIIKAIKDYENN